MEHQDTSARQRVFMPRWDDDRQAVIYKIDENMPIKVRKDMSRYLHEEVQQPRLLTEEEKKATHLLQLPVNKIHYHDIDGMDVPAVASVNAEWLFQHGHLSKLLAIRKRMLHKDYQPKLAKECKKKEAGYEGRAGTTYQLGLTIQPHFGASSTQIGTLSRHEQQSNVREDFLGLIKSVSDIIHDFMPELEGNGRRQNQLSNASIVPGHAGNINATSMQINFSDLQAGLAGIKKFGALHPDGNDYWTTLTSMVIFSEVPDNVFCGFLNVTPLGVVIPLAPIMIVWFPANLFHVSTGLGIYAVPAGSELRIDPPRPGIIPQLLPRKDYPYRRLTIPIYADRRLMKPRFSQFNPELYAWTGPNGQLGGKALYRRRLEHVKWMMTLYIVNEPEIRWRLVKDAWQILMENKRRDALGVPEELWAGRIPRVRFDEGSGPDILLHAFKTCKRLGANALESRIARHGDPDFYVRLFAYFDGATETTTYPPRQHAVDVLNAVTEPNPEFEAMQKELAKLNCGTRTFVGDKGAVIWLPKMSN